MAELTRRMFVGRVAALMVLPITASTADAMPGTVYWFGPPAPISPSVRALLRSGEFITFTPTQAGGLRVWDTP